MSKRSVTLIREKTKEKLAAMHVDFDKHNRAIGEYQPKFASYCGVTARSRISILKESWDKVSKSELHDLWLDIKNYWNIPNDAPKKQTLQVCNKSWRAYKSTLVTDFMDNGLDASSFYPYLTKEAWEDFVKLKSTEEFQEKRKKGKETVKKNKNPAHLGPLGYRGNKARWDKDIELGAKIKGHHISSEQARDFIYARTKRTPSGDYIVAPESEQLADEFISKDKPGVDLMATVLGKEHPGRTRAVGYNVTLKESRINQRNKKQQELPNLEDLVTRLEERLFNKLYEKLYDKLMTDMVPDMMAKVVDTVGDMVDSMVATSVNHGMMQHDDTRRNEEIKVRSPKLKKPSVVSTMMDALDNIKAPIECQLLLPSDTQHHIVAEGKVYPSENGMSHGIPLKEHHVKVSIRKIYDGYKLFPLPVPTEETCNLRNALYGFKQWPRNSIALVKPTPTVQKDQRPPHTSTTIPTPTPTPSSTQIHQKRKYEETNSLPLTKKIRQFVMPKELNGRPKIKLLYKNFMTRNIEYPIHVRSEPGIIFGAGRTDVVIYPDVIKELMKNKQLDVDSIFCFQMMLHSMFQHDNKCAFINPQKITTLKCGTDEEIGTNVVVNELVDAMNFHQDKDIFLAPYLQGFHYILFVVCPRTHACYILDSCQGMKTFEDYDIVTHIEKAVATLNKQSKSRSRAMTWNIAKNLWNDKTPFSDAELDDFVEFWMTSFVKNYLK
ncbi:unnamed protein product [Lactuca virosa]|uniref:DUF8039 domain-containing protein n=1 Tax=Lactuca virosa TaxID=75947 RepID=A0AAU9LGW5_9ASTR|nr:unnamed protein product [Lactuca virosa]